MFLSQRTPPVHLGIEFRTDAAYVAFVRADDERVVGLGTSPYPTGTVTDHVIHRPDVARAAVEHLLRRVGWSAVPSAAVVIDPVGVNDDETIVSAPIIEDGTVGTATAAGRSVDAVLAAATSPSIEIEVVDCAPVAVVRYARRAEPDLDIVFARGTSAGLRWTACADVIAVDIELERTADGPEAPMVGVDPSHLLPPRWGRLDVVSRVADHFTTPGRFTPAVGAALGLCGHAPAVDLAGPQATCSGNVERRSTWGVEVVR